MCSPLRHCTLGPWGQDYVRRIVATTGDSKKKPTGILRTMLRLFHPQLWPKHEPLGCSNPRDTHLIRSACSCVPLQGSCLPAVDLQYRASRNFNGNAQSHSGGRNIDSCSTPSLRIGRSHDPHGHRLIGQESGLQSAIIHGRTIDN